MNNSISLSKFLSRYAALEGKDLKKVTHKEVKTLFPFLKRAGFEDVDRNPELITSGKVMLVDDGHRRLYYYVPEKEHDAQMMQFSREEVDTRIIPDDKVYDYVNMSIYELRCLLVRKFNSTRNQYCARRELNRRGIPITRKYKRIHKKIYDID